MRLGRNRTTLKDSNLGPQDGRRRQNHGAMTATDSLIEGTAIDEMATVNYFNFLGFY